MNKKLLFTIGYKLLLNNFCFKKLVLFRIVYIIFLKNDYKFLLLIYRYYF